MGRTVILVNCKSFETFRMAVIVFICNIIMWPMSHLPIISSIKSHFVNTDNIIWRDKKTISYGEIKKTISYGEIKKTISYGEIKKTISFGEIKKTMFNLPTKKNNNFPKILWKIFFFINKYSYLVLLKNRKWLVAVHGTASIQQIHSLTLTSAEKYLNRYMSGELSKHWK